MRLENHIPIPKDQNAETQGKSKREGPCILHTIFYLTNSQTSRILAQFRVLQLKKALALWGEGLNTLGVHHDLGNNWPFQNARRR